MGVDGSEKMIGLCMERFPNQHFIVADMREVELVEKFQLVLAWHSFFHLLADDQRKMIKRFSAFLKLGGLLAFTSGPAVGEVWSDNGGVDLYHASLSTDEYRFLLEMEGFEVIAHKVV
jgi:trans-aconitate methyltransferase